MAWNYAELSKLAKKNGGPEKLVELLVKSGQKKMRPWLVIAFTAGGIVTVGVQFIIKHFAKKKVISDAEVEAAKKKLIKGIKDYDASQLSVKNDGVIESGDENNKSLDIYEVAKVRSSHGKDECYTFGFSVDALEGSL
jgi:hypothetical protein